MMLKKDYKLYAFDFDGTLVDTREDIALSMREVMKEAGLNDATDEEIRASIGGGARKAVQRLTGFDGKDLDHYVGVFEMKYEELCNENTTIYEGGEDLIKRLKSEGKLLAVITMKARKPTHKILKRHGLFELFDDVIAFDDVEKRKPDPESFFKLLAKHALKSSEALMVGDTTTDIKYAKNAGVDACVVTYGYGQNEDLKGLDPEYFINSLKEL